MRSDCIRLLVADRLRLGQPVRTRLPLTDEARDRVIDSTYHAWRQIYSTAIDREVDAVILNGDALFADDHSAEAEQALRDGLALLCAAGVRVMLHPAHDESALSWREFLAEDAELRDGTSLIAGAIQLQICHHSEEAHEDQDNLNNIVYRFVSIEDHNLPHDEHGRNNDSREDRSPFTIGLSSLARPLHALPPGIDLLISGGSAWWTGSGEASPQHYRCAAPQALSQEEADNELDQGCLLIELFEHGEVRAERLPTAAVRFLNCELDLASCSDWDDAALLLQNQIEAVSWEDLERVRLITWSLTAGDALSQQLLDGPGVELLNAAWSRTFPLEDDLQVVHGFESAGHSPSRWLNPQTDAATRELAEALFQQELSGTNHRLERLKDAWPPDEHSAQLWTRLNPHLSHPQISRHAETLISHWLNSNDPENLPYETHLS